MYIELSDSKTAFILMVSTNYVIYDVALWLQRGMMALFKCEDEVVRQYTARLFNAFASLSKGKEYQAFYGVVSFQSLFILGTQLLLWLNFRCLKYVYRNVLFHTLCNKSLLLCYLLSSLRDKNLLLHSLCASQCLVQLPVKPLLSRCIMWNLPLCNTPQTVVCLYA